MSSTSLFPNRPLVWDPRGRRHIVVRDRADRPLPDGARPETIEVWSAVHDPRVASAREGNEIRFRSVAQLLETLAGELHAAYIGTRLYGAGTESFLAAVARCGAAAGLCDEEMFLAPPAGDERPVICVHCDTLAPSVRGGTLLCGGCGAPLTVRPHFSRRLSAYLGVWEPQAADTGGTEA